MYAEIEDPSYPDAHLMLYPSYGLGNQFFESTETTTTSGSRGLYYMFDNSTLIGEAYLLNPTDTYQEALLEMYGASSSAACPTSSGSLFGTEGTAGKYDAASELFIIRHGYVLTPGGPRSPPPRWPIPRTGNVVAELLRVHRKGELTAMRKVLTNAAAVATAVLAVVGIAVASVAFRTHATVSAGVLQARPGSPWPRQLPPA